MSNISVTDTDFSEFEAQFGSSVRVEQTEGQLRVRGLVVAFSAGVALWIAIGVGIAAAIHGFA